MCGAGHGGGWWLVGSGLRGRDRGIDKGDHTEMGRQIATTGWHSGEERQVGHGRSSSRVKRAFDGTVQLEGKRGGCMPLRT